MIAVFRAIFGRGRIDLCAASHRGFPDRIALAAAAAPRTPPRRCRAGRSRRRPPAPPRMLPEDVTEAADRRSATCACVAPRTGAAPFGEPLADVRQHDRREDGEQFLDQVTTTSAVPPTPRRRLAVVAAEDVRDELVALLCIDLVDVTGRRAGRGAWLGDLGLELVEPLSSAWTFSARPRPAPAPACGSRCSLRLGPRWSCSQCPVRGSVRRDRRDER